MRRSILAIVACGVCTMWAAAAEAQTAAASPSQQNAARPATPAASVTVVPKGVDTPPDYVIGPDDILSVVYPLYMQREITRSNVRDVVRKGLQEARGNYKIVARLFNMEQGDYKRFLNFLRKHDCQVPFKEYR